MGLRTENVLQPYSLLVFQGLFALYLYFITWNMLSCLQIRFGQYECENQQFPWKLKPCGCPVLFCFLYRTKTARTTAPKLGFISVLFSLIITLKQMAPGDMQISQLPGLSLCGIFAWCNWPAANKTKWVWTPTHAQSAGRTNALSAVYFVYCASLFCVCDTE